MPRSDLIVPHPYVAGGLLSFGKIARTLSIPCRKSIRQLWDAVEK